MWIWATWRAQLVLFLFKTGSVEKNVNLSWTCFELSNPIISLRFIHRERKIGWQGFLLSVVKGSAEPSLPSNSSTPKLDFKRRRKSWALFCVSFRSSNRFSISHSNRFSFMLNSSFSRSWHFREWSRKKPKHAETEAIYGQLDAVEISNAIGARGD